MLSTVAPLSLAATSGLWSLVDDATTFLGSNTAALGLLSALLAAVLTHLFTRRRGHREWIRERQFEAMGRMREAARTFTYGVYEGIGLKSDIPDVFDWVPPEEDRDWSDVNEAHREYEKALMDLDLLTTDPVACQNMAVAIKAIRAVHTDLRRARGRMDERGLIPKDAHRQLTDTLREFRSTHLDLVERIRAAYILDGAMPLRHRLHGWWLNRRDATAARRAAKEHKAS